MRFRVEKTLYVRQVQGMDMIVDFPLVLQHQVQTILTMQRQRRFLRASSLVVEDLPEIGQRQDQTPENPEDCRQDTRTDRRDIFRSPRRSRSLSRYHELFRD